MVPLGSSSRKRGFCGRPKKALAERWLLKTCGFRRERISQFFGTRLVTSQPSLRCSVCSESPKYFEYEHGVSKTKRGRAVEEQYWGAGKDRLASYSSSSAYDLD